MGKRLLPDCKSERNELTAKCSFRRRILVYHKPARRQKRAELEIHTTCDTTQL